MGSFHRYAAVAVVAALLAVSAVAAQGGARHRGPRAEDFEENLVAHLTYKLGLSEVQSEALRSIIANHKEGALGDVMRDMREARANLAGAIHDPKRTDDEVADAAAAVGVIEARIAVERHHMANEISRVLTAEQRQELSQFVEERHERGIGPPPDGPYGF